MRAFLSVASSAAAILLAITGIAEAKIAINVDKDTQQMTVAVDGVPRYTWPVSSGNPSHETPNGRFQTFRMEEDHYSKEFDDAPMPHAIFFTKQGHAIHGTDSVNRLGSPASHGCVRLSRANAQTLFDMVKADGVMNTTVTLTGSSQVALANNPRPASRQARRAQPDYVTSPDVDAAGNPLVAGVEPLPPARQIMPRRQAPAGYVYSDGSQIEANGYTAPRGYRRGYDAQGNPLQQYYVDRGYAQQGYAPQYAPQQYYQPRGYYGQY